MHKRMYLLPFFRTFDILKKLFEHIYYRKETYFMIEARAKLKEARRIVIKIGTSSLVYKNGKVNLNRIQTLARVISDLMNREKDMYVYHG